MFFLNGGPWIYKQLEDQDAHIELLGAAIIQSYKILEKFFNWTPAVGGKHLFLSNKSIPKMDSNLLSWRPPFSAPFSQRGAAYFYWKASFVIFKITWFKTLAMHRLPRMSTCWQLPVRVGKHSNCKIQFIFWVKEFFIRPTFLSTIGLLPNVPILTH